MSNGAGNSSWSQKCIIAPESALLRETVAITVFASYLYLVYAAVAVIGRDDAVIFKLLIKYFSGGFAAILLPYPVLKRWAVERASNDTFSRGAFSRLFTGRKVFATALLQLAVILTATSILFALYGMRPAAFFPVLYAAVGRATGIAIALIVPRKLLLPALTAAVIGLVAAVHVMTL